MFATRWNTLPSIWKEMSRLQNEMDQTFGLSQPRSGQSGPPLNAWQSDDSLHVELDVPGLELDDLQIEVKDGRLLSISGKRQRPEQEGQWLRRERAFGEFSRTVELPFEIEADQVTAVLKHGVLRIELPKREQDRPRKIDIQVA